VNYSKILEELNNASLFELYRLEQAIRRNLEDPVRIRKIKDLLKVGRKYSSNPPAIESAG